MEDKIDLDINRPHGKKLVNLLVGNDRIKPLKDISFNLKDIILNDRQICDFELIATGAFSPLNGFMVRSNYESVLDRMRLQNGLVWPIPICLDVSKIQADNLEAGQSVTIRDQEGFLLAIMHLEDIFLIDKKKEAKLLFGTQDIGHPGVNYLFNNTGDYYIGGKLDVLSLPLHADFRQIRQTPKEVRGVYKKLGWKKVVGFHTRHPIHKPQFEITITAMGKAKANLLINSVAETTKPGNFDYYTRVRCYKEVIKNYPPETSLLNLIPMSMRMAGPREAVLHMIIAKNFGCTHFIVGYNHAVPTSNNSEKSFYDSNESCKLAMDFSKEIGIAIVPFKQVVYLPEEDEFKSMDNIPKDFITASMTNKMIRERIRAGRKIPHWITFAEVIKELKKSYPPPSQQGVTIFLTGLSGAGKSTIAKILYARFLEIGKRPVTLLDGDIVRRNLSNELKFTKEHRDINVRRIGFVASEITKNRGIAICAPIAPYEFTRDEIRATIEMYGGFIEVYISTPIIVCEKRDRKGMYAKARAGLIKGFTGVDDPYEIPKFPEIQINTTDITPDESVQEILLFLGQKGYI